MQRQVRNLRVHFDLAEQLLGLESPESDHIVWTSSGCDLVEGVDDHTSHAAFVGWNEVVRNGIQGGGEYGIWRLFDG